MRICYIVKIVMWGFCIYALLDWQEHMTLGHGCVYLDACGTDNGCDLSDNIVLANSGCKCNHTQWAP